jgi:hypothetical protein
LLSSTSHVTSASVANLNCLIGQNPSLLGIWSAPLRIKETLALLTLISKMRRSSSDSCTSFITKTTSRGFNLFGVYVRTPRLKHLRLLALFWWRDLLKINTKCALHSVISLTGTTLFSGETTGNLKPSAPNFPGFILCH